MKKQTNRLFVILLCLALALTLGVSALALSGSGTSESPFVLELGNNQTTLWTLESPNSASFYTFTPTETDEYVIRSESGADSVPHLIFDSIGYSNWFGSGEIYCKKELTANTQYAFNIYDETTDNSAVTIVIEKYAEPSNALSLGDNALSLNRKNYAEDYSFTPETTGVYEFSSSGYGQPGCLWGSDDYGAEGWVGETYSWQFRFEKELTAGTTYTFKPYNQSGAYEGTVTITKKEAATVELDSLSLSFGTAPAILNTIGSATVELPDDSHCSVEWTWTDAYGNELDDDAVFRCGSYFLSASITPDSGYLFADGATATFDGLENAVDPELLVSNRSVYAAGQFVFGSGHTYAGWEEMSDNQILEAGLGAPYAGHVWEQNACTVCEYTKYRGGDSAEICVIELTLSGAPAANLTADDITVAVPADRPYYLIPASSGADPDYPGWIGTLGENARFLCRSDYTGFCVLMPTEGHYFTRDGDLEIQIEVTPADAVIATRYVFISGSEAVYVSADFAQTDHIYQAPVWRWADDYSEAYADFACVYGDWTVTATVHNPPMTIVSDATYTQDRIVKFTATTIFRDETYVKESGNVTVEGSAAALLTADTATFNAYKTEKADELDALAETGDSAACQSLITNAKAEINALAFDANKSLDENKAAVDTEKEAVEAILAQGLAMQRAEEALAADKAAFDAYKAEKAAALDALAKDGDSDASKKLIADAKAEINALAYDETKTLDENKAAANAKADAVTSQLSTDLAAQREADAQQGSGENSGNSSGSKKGFFARLWERIVNFFRRLFGKK